MSYLEKLYDNITSLLYVCDIKYTTSEFILRMFAYGIVLSLVIFAVLSAYSTSLSFFGSLFIFAIFEISIYFFLLVSANKRTAQLEESLPDFLAFMASNIRSGITYDRALLLSAKKEFGYLSREIDYAAKESLAGKPLQEVLLGLGRRSRSVALSKSMRLIVQGFNSGGNLASLLDQTAIEIRRFSLIRKEVQSSILVYKLFIFAAIALGAPLLYSVASFLIELIYESKQRIFTEAFFEGVSYLQLTPSYNPITPSLVFSFSLLAILITSFFGSLTSGIISKGEESEGIAYFPLVITISIAVFFLSRFLLESFVKKIFLL